MALLSEVPGDNMAVPGDNMAVPGDNMAVPGDNMAVPGDNMAVPGDHGAEHQDDQPSSGECYDEDRSEIPYTDAWTTALVDQAVDELATVRCPFGAADPAARLSCLVSLAAEAEASIIEAVAAAHEAGHSWDHIAMRMAETTEDVVERFGPYTAWRAAGRPLPVQPS